MNESILVSPGGVVDVTATLGPLRSGPRDPVQVHERDRVCRAVWIGEVAAVAQWQQVDAQTVEVSLDTGPGEPATGVELAQFALDTLGAADDPSEFRPQQDKLARLAKSSAGARFGRHPTASDVLTAAILGQRVTAEEAQRAWRGLVLDHGREAPRPWTLRMPPRPQCLAALPYYEFHRYGIDRNRAETIRRTSRELARRDDYGMLRRLETMRGIGPWTISILRQRVLGDPDAPIIGDFHIPNTIAWHLAGEARGTDERMLELLAQFDGQRGRAQRLVMQLGKAPKFGPKQRISRIADR